MAQNKYLNVNENVLIQWIYDSDNLLSENYSVVTDLSNDKEKNFQSSTVSNLNSLDKNLFILDPVLNKYAVINSTDYNFLQTQNYFTSPITYDKIRIHFPVDYDFDNYTLKGIILKVYAYDYDNKKTHNFSHYFYDNGDSNRQNELKLGIPFTYNEQQWGKYIDIEIPSIDSVSNQRSITTTSDSPSPNSINSNMSSIGISKTSPIFIDFSFLTSTNVVFDKKYYYGGSIYRTSLSKTPEYQTLAVNVDESSNGDYFEIYGTYGNSLENLDDFIEELNAKGRQIELLYDITLYEENIAQRTVTYTVTENFSQKILYRPIITFSNTTAAINVEMKVHDLVDNSIINRFASLGLTNNLFKYGRNLRKIDTKNVFKPIIYNNQSNEIKVNKENIQNTTNINITKVNYPVLVDRYKIVTSSTNSSTNEYKSNGTLEILLTPFDNFLKFKVAKTVDENGVAEPYNMSDIIQNSEITLIFKSDTMIIDKPLFRTSSEIDFANGILVFKVEESDRNALKTIADDGYSEFYLVLKNVTTNTRTLLYSGKFRMYEDVKFLEKTKLELEQFSSSDISSSLDENNKNTIIEENVLSCEVCDFETPENYSNALVFLNPISSVVNFENYLEELGVTIHTKYNYTYFITTLPLSKLVDISKRNDVDNIIQIPFDLGNEAVPELTYRQERILYWEAKIRNSEDWLDSVQQKAIQHGRSLADQIRLDAIWMYENKDDTKPKPRPGVNILNQGERNSSSA